MARNKYPEETVTLILDTAQALFLEKGYDGTTVQDIIDGLGGLTKGAIYHHFKSKEEILTAVTARLFSNNTLSTKWENTIADSKFTGAEKLKAMLYEAISDEQEQSFRNMDVNLQNMPQMLSDLLLRSVKDVAPKAFKPVLEQGISDGSIKATDPDSLAQVISLLANVWLNPLVFPVSNSDLHRKYLLASELLSPFGIDIRDLYPAVADMNAQINKK